MKTRLYRLIGFALIIASIGGLVSSLFGIVSTWRLRPYLIERLQEDVGLFGEALATTDQALATAELSLATSISSITALQDTIEASGQALNETTPMVNTMAKLSREDLPRAVSSAQTSLEAAQESARIIDAVLRALTQIPFVSPNLYNPSVPLHVALQQLSASMDQLPEAFTTIEKSLAASNESLVTIQGDMQDMSDDIRAISDSLDDAQEVVGEYQSVLLEMQTRLAEIEAAIPVQLTLAAWVLTFFLSWAAIAQLGLFILGWEMIQNHFVRQDQGVVAVEPEDGNPGESE